MPITREPPVTISVQVAAATLGVSRTTAYRLAATGEIPAVRVGRSLRVPVHRLVALLDGKTAANGGE